MIPERLARSEIGDGARNPVKARRAVARLPQQVCVAVCRLAESLGFERRLDVAIAVGERLTVQSCIEPRGARERSKAAGGATSTIATLS
jgi:hypothetical protein